ncbi:hypothetical protein [Candidatus Poriferisodalis sp.]|uniref:hypothetical protein n=1 Tax=Candidatus Poriferisodalis sp. TaxID=3101277 RepID=UPI003D11793C
MHSDGLGQFPEGILTRSEYHRFGSRGHPCQLRLLLCGAAGRHQSQFLPGVRHERFGQLHVLAAEQPEPRICGSRPLEGDCAGGSSDARKALDDMRVDALQPIVVQHLVRRPQLDGTVQMRLCVALTLVRLPKPLGSDPTDRLQRS